MSEDVARQIARLEIASPCTQPWEDMEGDARTRFCQACRLHVHDLSQLTTTEVAALLGESRGRLCARVFRRPDGTILTADCAPARRRVAQRLRRIRVGVTALLATLGLAGCRSAPEYTVTTGVIALPDDFQAAPAPQAAPRETGTPPAAR